MARPRSFDEAVVVDAATRCFTDLGYAATSVDDLVSATGLHRGSLYGAFGSKRGLFLAALTRPTSTPREDPEDDDERALDLLLVAALELAPHDDEVRHLVRDACGALGPAAATVLGRRLLERARLEDDLPEADTPPSVPTGPTPDTSNEEGVMARIRVSDGQLEVRLTGLDALWALRRRLVVPLTAVRGATADPGAAAEPKGVRAPGLHLPGVAAVGTFHRGGDKTLYAVHSGRRTVVVQMEPGADTSGFARAVVEVPDPRAAVDDVNRALSRR